jgi:Lrp/AsnC family transcriptional regulator for asnA, asnC and gidA
MTLRNQLDEIDLNILDIITKNARIPFKDVAAEVGVSRAAVHQRVNRMIDMNVIIGSDTISIPKRLIIRHALILGIS